MSDTTPEQDFAAALAAFQAEVPPIGKTAKADAGKYGYSYATLDHILSTIGPLLAKHGFAYTALPTMTEHGFALRYALLHKAGHREEGFYPLPDPERIDPQKIGSAISYARRYALTAVTGVAPADEDDDGAKAAEGFTAGEHSRSKVARASKGQVDTQDDPWTAPVERVTDVAWFADIQARLDLCGTAGEVRGLIDEARGKWTGGQLSDADAQVWKGMSDARLTELTAKVPA